jgi:hypothetical protein
MYSPHDVDGSLLQSLSPSETIPPDVPSYVNQTYRHHSASWRANVSSNSATIHHNDSTASVSHQRSKPWRLPGLPSFANIAGKIPLFCRAPRQASENRVTTSARPSRKEHRPADSPSSPILGTTSHDQGGQVSLLFDLMLPLVVLTSSLRCRHSLVQTTPKTLLSDPYLRPSHIIYSL